MRQYVQQKKVAARSVAGMNLLVPLQGCTDRLFTLNEAGRRLWECLESPKTEAELAESLRVNYGLSTEIAGQDVRLFLEDMVRKRLVAEEEKIES